MKQDAQNVQIGDILKMNEEGVPKEIRDLRREIKQEDQKTQVKRDRLTKLEAVARALNLTIETEK